MSLPELRCLLCHAHVAMALDCLGSLRTASQEPFSLVIHDDGSLTDADVALLHERLQASVIRRVEADERMAELLVGLPNAQRFRTRQAYALKLFDLPMLGSGPSFSLMDSDVLFVRRVSGLFSWDGPARFMSDRINAYSLRPWQALGFPLPARVNVGLIQLQRSAYDPAYLDWFVGQDRLHAIPVWIEQTAWAAQAQRTGCTVIDPRQMRLAGRGVEVTGELAALHVVTPERKHLPSLVARLPDWFAQAPVTFRSVDPGRCSALGMFCERLRHRLMRD